MQKFIEEYNLMAHTEDKINLDHIQLIIPKIIDHNQDGYTSPKEIALFFKNVWEIPMNRYKLNKISKP